MKERNVGATSPANRARQLQSSQRAVSRAALRAIAGLMGGVCGRFFGDAERTSPEMTTGWMPTYGSGKGDEPMMSGKLFKRSSLHGTFQPRHFELLLNKQTGEVSSTGHCAPSDSNVFRTFAARSQVVLQYRSLQEKTVKQIQWSQVRAVNRCRPSANQEFEFTISLRPGVVAKDAAKDDVDAATAMPDVILRARDGLALEAWLAGSGAPLRTRANARRTTRAACARAVQTHACAYVRVWQACRRFNDHRLLSRLWRTRSRLVAAVVHFDHPKSGRSAKRAASSSHRIYWWRPSDTF